MRKVRAFHPQVIPWEELGVGGERSQIKNVITPEHSDSLGAGFCRFETCSFPWTLAYDECLYVIEGRAEVTTSGRTVAVEDGEMLFIPRGNDVVYNFPGHCFLFYVAYPVNWQEVL